MSFDQLFQQGFRYIGGASKPFFVSQSKITSWATEQGFTNIHVVSRDDLPNKTVPFPVPSDDWDTIVNADFLGPDKVISLPKEPAWLFGGQINAASPSSPVQSTAVALPPQPPPELTPAQKQVALIAGGVAVVGVIGAFAYLVWKDTSKKGRAA